MEHHDTCNSGFSTATAPDYGTLFWQQETDGLWVTSPVVVNGRVYVGAEDNALSCYHGLTGELLWEYPTVAKIQKTPAVWADKVYFGVDEDYVGTIYCLNATTGEFIWSSQMGVVGWFNMVTTSPVIKDGLLFVGSFNGNEYCFDALTGDSQWSFQTYGYVYSAAAVADGNVFFGSYDGFLYCVNAENGDFLWNFNASEPGDEETEGYTRQITSAPSISGDKIVFSTDQGMVFCLNRTLQGQLIWQVQAGNGGCGISPAIAYNRVYMATRYLQMQEPHFNFAQVYYINLSTGLVDWIFSVEPGNYWGEQAYSCAVADGKVYFGVCITYYYPDRIYCLDALHEKYLWYREVSDEIRITPAIANNKLYITTADGMISCFQDEDEQPPNQPPLPAMNPSPANNSLDISLISLLTWTGADPDEEPLTYDVYFGTTNPPPKMTANQSAYTFDPGVLQPGTVYYWKIVSWDYRGGHTEGSLWTFTTQKEKNLPSVTIITPKEGYIYVNNHELFKRFLFKTTLIIRPITIEVEAVDDSGIRNVKLYIDDTLMANLSSAPYTWRWEEPAFFRHIIKVVAYDNVGNSIADQMTVKKFF